jgi:hypothetical protein
MRGRRAYRQAGLIMAPSITTPALTYFQSATSSFRASATIVVLRRRPPLLTTVMSAPRRDLAVVDAGLKALAFDSGPPVVWNRPGVTYAGASDEHGKLVVSEGAGSRRASASGSGSSPAIATRPSTVTTGMSAAGETGSSAYGPWRPGAGWPERKQKLRHAKGSVYEKRIGRVMFSMR